MSPLGYRFPRWGCGSRNGNTDFANCKIAPPKKYEPRIVDRAAPKRGVTFPPSLLKREDDENRRLRNSLPRSGKGSIGRDSSSSGTRAIRAKSNSRKCRHRATEGGFSHPFPTGTSDSSSPLLLISHLGRRGADRLMLSPWRISRILGKFGCTAVGVVDGTPSKRRIWKMTCLWWLVRGALRWYGLGTKPFPRLRRDPGRVVNHRWVNSGFDSEKD